jgi:hypothetical protein
MCLKIFERGKLDDRRVGGGEVNRWGDAVFERLDPGGDADAPAVARVQAGEVIFGPWADQVIALAQGKFEERGGHHSTDRVQA